MKMKLGDFLLEVNERTTRNNEYPVLTASKECISLQNQYFKKPVASKDNTGYKVIHRGQFTYRAMSDTGNFYPNILESVNVGIVSPAYPVFEITNKELVLPKYLKYYFKSPVFQFGISKIVQGTTRANLHFNKMKTIEIDVPSVDEQYEVVNCLSKVTSLMEKKKKEIVLLNTMLKARFVEMFGDPILNTHSLQTVELQQLGSWGSGGTPSRKNDEYFKGNIDWYSAGELNSQYLKKSKEKITQQAIENSATQLLPSGSLLVGMYDTAAFKMGVVTKESSCNQACAFLIPNYSVNVVWLYHELSLMKPYFLQQRHGVRQKNLNLGMIKKFMVPIVDINDQNVFVNFVQQVDKSKAAIQKSIDETQLLYDSLMQKYFG